MAYHVTRQVPLRILAIDPGTRELGYAVLEGTELLHFDVHTFAHRLSATDLEDAGRQFLRALVETFAPQVFVIERMVSPQSRRSTRLPAFIRAMKRFATRHGLYVRSFTPTMIKIAIVGDDAASKRAVAETLVRQGYPYLTRYLQIDLRTGEHYWEHMFDAVALGLTAYEEITAQRVLNTFRGPFTGERP
jgi:Holliday junction resolvasome RuvABC endonuclease subunit